MAKSVKAKSRVAKMMRGDMETGAAPAPMSPPKPSKTISIRQIDNGYIISESGNDKEGRYYSREKYSKENPVSER